MANLTRSAKSSRDWSNNELMAYNITISSLPPADFFTTPEPSLDHIDPAILNSPFGDVNPALSNIAADYLGYLSLATNGTQESFIVNFAAATLRLLDFGDRHTLVFMNHIIPPDICGEAIAQIDVCLIHCPTFISLVLIKNKTLTNMTNAEAQVIAEAIASFQYNNQKRRQHGLNPLDVMTIPCIIMSGTRPAFYLVPVTMELSNAVITGQYPAAQTQVLRCLTLPTHVRCASTGMEDTEYRKLALERFLAFKSLAKRHWECILEGI